MSRQTIRILQLYPQDMNIYGDAGNVLTLQRRLEWYGYDAQVLSYNVGDVFPEEFDLVVAGGGQDSGQVKILDDLLERGPRLVALAEDGMPMLVVCGTYQLFGRFFTTLDGQTLTGIGLLDMETYGTRDRLIGNIVTESEEFGEIVGYENHSGQTYLKGAAPLARTVRGAGNNLSDGHEGARIHNVIGTYLHGSLLPKNPRVADFLIDRALKRSLQETLEGKSLDDSLAAKARSVAKTRPR